MSKTINDSNIDLNKFPASRFRQSAKKMENSKPTAKHIKQVASEPQAIQVHLMRHQCTELPPNKFQRKQRNYPKLRQATSKHYQEEKKEKECHKCREEIIIFTKLLQVRKYASEDRCKKCGDSPEFRCPASRYQCKNCHMFGHFSSLHYMKKSQTTRENQENPEHIN